MVLGGRVNKSLVTLIQQAGAAGPGSGRAGRAMPACAWRGGMGAGVGASAEQTVEGAPPRCGWEVQRGGAALGWVGAVQHSRASASRAPLAPGQAPAPALKLATRRRYNIVLRAWRCRRAAARWGCAARTATSSWRGRWWRGTLGLWARSPPSTPSCCRRGGEGRGGLGGAHGRGAAVQGRAWQGRLGQGWEQQGVCKQEALAHRLHPPRCLPLFVAHPASRG